MRTIEQLKQEIALRKELDLPHIVLTLEEKKRAFGDCSYDYRDNSVRIQLMIERQSKGLKLSRNDLKELKSYLANTRENT
jgi:hypothetical protein